jgi:hypothetical protein
MLFTVSTVKETVAGLSRFVERNLAGGVDHLIVFVDDADPLLVEWAASHPHVTAVPTGRPWWQGTRPGQLNARQRINANLARTALAVLPGAEWLFHVDGDEVLQVDRAALSAVPAEVPVVRATPLEAVSQWSWPDDEVTHFKRLLSPDSLTLLNVLGVIDRPVNEELFHGHVRGKSGMRPALDRWHSLHDVEDAAQEALAGDDSGLARVLHYESFSGEEFVRKWTNLIGSGAPPNLRNSRKPLDASLRWLLASDLPDEVRATYLRRLYELTTQDDLETLRDLGLLEELPPGTHTPAALPPSSSAALSLVLTELGAEDTRVFRTGESADDATAALGRVAERLKGRDEGLVPDWRQVWTGASGKGWFRRG